MRQIVSYNSEKRPHWVGDGFPLRSLLRLSAALRRPAPFCCSITPGRITLAQRPVPRAASALIPIWALRR